MVISIIRITFILLEIMLIHRFFYGLWAKGVSHQETYDNVTLFLPILIILLPILYFLIKKWFFNSKK